MNHRARNIIALLNFSLTQTAKLPEPERFTFGHWYYSRIGEKSEGGIKKANEHYRDIVKEFIGLLLGVVC